MNLKTIIAALALPGAVALAAVPQVEGLETGRDGSRFFLNMTVNPKVMDRGVNNRVELTPVVISADSSKVVELPSVTVAGTNMYYSTIRNGAPAAPDYLLRAGKSDPMAYTASVPYEDWMDVSSVQLLTRYTGCCDGKRGPDELFPIAEIDMRPRSFNPNFAYIVPVDKGDKQFELSGRANIRFIVNRTNIDWTYANNYAELDSILRSVNAVKDNPDATVDSIILTGYASPEGSYDNNVRLAKGRTEVVKEYVRNHASFPANVYHTDYVPEDWGGLREWLVNSNIENRDAMIAFIDDPTIPVRTKNDVFMKRFPKEYPFLLKNVYPPLRHTDYRITYKVRKYLSVDEIRRVFETRPNNLSLNEFFVLANSYEKGSPAFDEVFDKAVEYYPSNVTANLNAANSAMNRGQFERAETLLRRAGNDRYATYGMGVLNALQGNYDAAKPLFEKAERLGVAEATDALNELKKATTATGGVRYIQREIRSVSLRK